MIHLIYISSATNWPSTSDLKDLLQQSRERNLKKNITGMLLYDNATYMQVLEGDSTDVHDIYNSIMRDPRNFGNVVLVEETIEQRDFPDWSMGFRDLNDCKAEELPGFIDVFDGKLDKQIAAENKAFAIQLLMAFAGKDSNIDEVTPA